MPPLPSIDFEREMVVVVALGRQRTGGFVVRIERAHREGENLIVVIREERPGPGCLVPGALTSPVDLARLPAYAGPIDFRSEIVTHDCPP